MSSRFWIYSPKWSTYLQRCLIVTRLVPRETAAVSARSVYVFTPCNYTRNFMESHTREVHSCLAVRCHLHRWQNDRDVLRVAGVTRAWKGYRNSPSTESWPALDWEGNSNAATTAGTPARDLSTTSPVTAMQRCSGTARNYVKRQK